MPDILEMLRNSKIRTDILRIANDLLTDSNYTKEDAAQDLVTFLEKNNI
ncbi:hypothetical protein [Peribacillus loiseleuriae]